MRNITAFAVLVIILSCVNTLPAQEKLTDIYEFSVTPVFGMLYGQAEEIVYPPSQFVAEMHSQLLWDMKPVLYYGLTMDFSRINPMEKWGLFSLFTLKYGIPGISGYMEDRDWLSVENDHLTHYSIHDNKTKEMFLLDFSAGASFPMQNNLVLLAYLNVSYMRFQFSGHDGFGKYAYEYSTDHYNDIDDNPREVTFKGKVINYSQNWLVLSPGLGLRYYFLNSFYTGLSFQITPLIFCADMDEHLQSLNDQYRDYTRGGLSLEPGFEFSCSVQKWLDISLKGSWRFIMGTNGEAYKRHPIGKGYYALVGASGTGLSVIDAGIYFKINL